MLDRRISYFPFGPTPPLDKSVEIIDYRWYYEHDESRENSKILLKGII